jgi:hypothetical protein
MTNIRSLVIALLLSVGLAVPHARADVFYSFVQTSFLGTCGFNTPPCVPVPTPILSVTIEVTDSAAANGFMTFQSAMFNNLTLQPEVPLDLAGTGIVRIAVQVTGGSALFFLQSGPGGGSFSSGALSPPTTGYFDPGWDVRLIGGPAGFSELSIDYFGMFDDLTFGMSLNGTASGTFVTDAPVNGCHDNPGCSFAGVMTVSTPEPASMGLLTVGVIGMLALSRRRRPIRIANRR